MAKVRRSRMSHTDQEVPHPDRFPGSDKEFKMIRTLDGHISPMYTDVKGELDDFEYDPSNEVSY